MTYGRLVRYAKRCGIPVDDPEGDAQERLSAMGAARDGIYHPPVPPWEGHPVDVVWTDMNRAPWPWKLLLAFGAIIVICALIGAVW